MVNENTFFLLVLIAFIFTIRFAASISCFQCNNTDTKYQFLCTENMVDSDSLRPQPCTSVHNAAYCVTLVGLHGGGLGVSRYCSSLNLGNYCNYSKWPGDVLKLEYLTCVYTCDFDGCNGSIKREQTVFDYIKNLSIVRWFRNLSF